MRLQRKKFIDEYVKTYLEGIPNATQAAINAGYAERSAGVQGCRLLKNDKIKKAIDDKIAEISENCKVTSESVISRLRDIQARAREAGDLHAEIRATDLEAKIGGLVPDKVIEKAPQAPQLSEEQTKQALELAKLRGQKLTRYETEDIYGVFGPETQLAGSHN